MKRPPVHGTYPFDSGRWVKVRTISIEEAAKLLDLEVPEEPERHYLLLNKGFIVPRLMKQGGVTEFQAAMMEQIGTFSPKDVVVGDEAVYVHDGDYMIIRRVGDAQG